jgi:hypothetical protein
MTIYFNSIRFDSIHFNITKNGTEWDGTGRAKEGKECNATTLIAIITATTIALPLSLCLC